MNAIGYAIPNKGIKQGCNRRMMHHPTHGQCI